MDIAICPVEKHEQLAFVTALAGGVTGFLEMPNHAVCDGSLVIWFCLVVCESLAGDLAQVGNSINFWRNLMPRFLGVFRHEFNMSIRRPGLWIAFGLLFLFYTLSAFWQSSSTEKVVIANDEIWRFAGRMGFTFNLFLPVAAAIIVDMFFI